MDRKRIILVDKEPNAVAALRKVLLTAGFDVRVTFNGRDALALAENFLPSLIMAETRSSGKEMDGPQLLEEVRKRANLQGVPFVLMGKLATVEERLAVMKLPLDDYLQKPFEAEEAAARLEGLIKEAELRGSVTRPKWRGFSGNLSEMNLFDLVQIVSVGKKTCVLKLQAHGKSGAVYIGEGELLDAELERLEARRALLRMFTWTEGTFQVELRPHERGRMLTTPTHDLLSEGRTRQDRWSRLLAQMPPLHSRVVVKSPASTSVLNEEESNLLHLISAQKTGKSFSEIVEENPADELRTLTVLKRLHERGLLLATAAVPEKKTGDAFEHFKQWHAQNGNTAAELGARLEHLLAAHEETNTRVNERRQAQRRATDRRQNDRRRGLALREKAGLFLKKSELLMIREKLAR